MPAENQIALRENPERPPARTDLLLSSWGTYNQHGNDPFENTGNIYGFFEAHPAHVLKGNLVEGIREILHGERIFSGNPEDLRKHTMQRVYSFDQTPNLVELPYDSVAMATKICCAKTDAFRALSDGIMTSFLGSSYSMDWEYFAGVGERLTVRELTEALPGACKTLFDSRAMFHDSHGYLPYAARRALDAGRPIVRRVDGPAVKRQFFNALTPAAIPQLVKLAERKGSQHAVADLIGEHRDQCGDHDGVHFHDAVTDLDGSVKYFRDRFWLHNDFVKAHAMFAGTVADLFRRKALEWPEARPWSAKEGVQRLAAQFTKDGREENRERKERNAGFEAVMKDVTAGPALKGDS